MSFLGSSPPSSAHVRLAHDRNNNNNNNVARKGALQRFPSTPPTPPLTPDSGDGGPTSGGSGFSGGRKTQFLVVPTIRRQIEAFPPHLRRSFESDDDDAVAVTKGMTSTNQALQVLTRK